MAEVLLTHQQNGRTLSYVCEKSGSSLVITHRIIVSSKEWRPVHHALMLVIICFMLLGALGLGFSGRLDPVLGALGLGFYWARRQRIVEETIVVMPTLGVQLETVYHSKRVRRRFVPLHKIVAPVINEAVSPVTCYFYLALLLRGEDNLLLTFVDIRPPLKMLVPIWKSLCEAAAISMAKPLGIGEELHRT